MHCCLGVVFVVFFGTRLIRFETDFFFFFHMSIIVMDLCNESCSSVLPSCVAKTLTLDITRKLFNQIFYTCHADMHYYSYTTFIDIALTRGSQGQHKAKHICFIFSHSFDLVRIKFDVTIKQFKLNILGEIS